MVWACPVFQLSKTLCYPCDSAVYTLSFKFLMLVYRRLPEHGLLVRAKPSRVGRS